MPARGGLAEYNRKRDFARTGEPKGARKKSGKKLCYLIQKHAARRLHYDFRLEWNGALLSWAVPKGPSLNPHDKRLAVHARTIRSTTAISRAPSRRASMAAAR